jgi:hypothetical protein
VDCRGLAGLPDHSFAALSRPHRADPLRSRSLLYACRRTCGRPLRPALGDPYLLFDSGPLHARADTLCAASDRPRLADLRCALRHWNRPRLQQPGFRSLLAQPGAQQPLCQSGHLGVHRLPDRQHRRACGGRAALHPAPGRRAVALERRGRGLRLHPVDAAGLPRAGGHDAYQAGAHGQERLQFGDHAGRLQICVPDQAAAWLHLAGFLCRVFGWRHGASAHLCR